MSLVRLNYSFLSDGYANCSCRAARELNQPYDLGLALLHMSACLRAALPRATLKQQLETVGALSRLS